MLPEQLLCSTSEDLAIDFCLVLEEHFEKDREDYERTQQSVKFVASKLMVNMLLHQP